MEKFEELLDAYRKEKDNKIGTRMLAVKMCYVDKMRIKNIADILTYSEDSISRWIKLYDDGGLDGLCDRPKSGRPPFISYDAHSKL